MKLFMERLGGVFAEAKMYFYIKYFCVSAVDSGPACSVLCGEVWWVGPRAEAGRGRVAMNYYRET